MAIYDYMICPKCGSDQCYDFSIDAIDFKIDGTGYYGVDCHCKNCNKDFRFSVNFEYKITESFAI